MKKEDVAEMKVIPVSAEGTKIPDGWALLKEPCKLTENGVDCFRAVIARCR
jgi:hypothetical protein